ncbi:MAG: hypothetical protein AAFP19_21345 [Bacteroidota bacterium]
MKNLLVCSCLLLLFHVAEAQSQRDHQIEFGLDITTPLIFAMGGDRDYDDFDFIYRESIGDRDLRFKFTISDYNYLGQEIISGRLIEDNLPLNLQYFQVRYFPTRNYLISAGIAKYSKRSKLPIYFGIDGNIGIGTGTVGTSLLTTMANGERFNNLSTKNNNQFLVGITPVLGLKKNLTDRIALGIELGMSIHAVFGEIEYEDYDNTPIARNINRLDIDAQRIINDVFILVKI